MLWRKEVESDCAAVKIMNVATKKVTELPILQATKAKVESATIVMKAERWVESVRWVALAIFVAVPFLGFFKQSLAGRVVWTLGVASLPLFIVLVGYHRWRRICPLAFFANLPTMLKRPGKHRASARLEANYYYVTVGMFILGLWLRLIAINGDGRMIALFFVVLSLMALASGLFFAGKTWCNYLCPVSFIEKIYTEPRGLQETRNSQCSKCTGCKSACPDVNQENSYWREINSRPKRHAYFIFPGLVLGFYLYYFLQAGAWDYYFGGRWTDEPGLHLIAFQPGHDTYSAGFFFMPVIPRAVAALLTLVICGLVSLLLFTQLEKLLSRSLSQRRLTVDATRVRHWTFGFAAFTAFVTFYSFAGAPTLQLVPWLHHLVLIVALVTATLFLSRRSQRTQADFAEIALARNILKHWEWSDTELPPDPHDAVLIHNARLREREHGRARLLEIYKEAIREALASGLATRQEVRWLTVLRQKLQIKPADHEKVMSELAEKVRARLYNSSQHIYAEKMLQWEAYCRTLKIHLDDVFTATTLHTPFNCNTQSHCRSTSSH